jgi:ribosomal protein L40E
MKKSKYNIFNLFQKKIVCGSCGEVNPADAKFCEKCASILRTYDGFMSYRRVPDAGLASLIVEKLKRLWDKDVFIDVEELQVGRFDEKLLKVIEDTPHFILILSQGCLDRCANKVDWLKHEIMHAIKTERNIIPVITDGFEFSQVKWHLLPPEMKILETRHGVQFSHIYQNASIESINTAMRLRVHPFKNPERRDENSSNTIEVDTIPKENSTKTQGSLPVEKPKIQIGNISVQTIQIKQNAVNIGQITAYQFNDFNKSNEVSIGTINAKII